MARYRPIDVRLWTDRRFLSLNDDGKLLWVFFLTTPSTLPIPGVIIGGEATLSEILGWTVERYREGVHELLKKGMKVRFEGRMVWLSNALKYQPPGGPNAIKGWSKTWDDIPEGELKDKIWDSLRIACKRWSVLFAKLFPKRFGEGYAQPLLEGFGNGLDTGSGSGSGSETGSGSGSGESPDLPLAIKSKMADVLPFPEPDPTQHFRLVDRGWERLNELRLAIARDHGWADVRKLPSRDAGRIELGKRLRESGADAESALDHVLAIAEAEARKKLTVEYLIGSMFDSVPWRKKLGMRIADAQRLGPMRAPAPAAPSYPKFERTSALELSDEERAERDELAQRLARGDYGGAQS